MELLPLVPVPAEEEVAVRAAALVEEAAVLGSASEVGSYPHSSLEAGPSLCLAPVAEPWPCSSRVAEP